MNYDNITNFVKMIFMKKLSLYFILFGCAVFTSQTAVSQSKKTDGELIEDLIAKKKEFNKEFSYGHRIQLYNGFEDEARAIQKKFKIDFPEIKTYISYKQPEWKIQVGFYKTKLEAERALLGFKRKYESAIVIPLGK